jgi:hypothetical protein
VRGHGRTAPPNAGARPVATFRTPYCWKGPARATANQAKRLSQTLGSHCDSKDETGETMQYFKASDGLPERIGKVIGDTLSSLVILMILWLVLNFIIH